jgi:hypothetical protein
LHGLHDVADLVRRTDEGLIGIGSSCAVEKGDSLVEMMGAVVVNAADGKAFADYLLPCQVEFGIGMDHSDKSVVPTGTQESDPLGHQTRRSGELDDGVHAVGCSFFNLAPCFGIAVLPPVDWNGSKMRYESQPPLVDVHTKEVLYAPFP